MADAAHDNRDDFDAALRKVQAPGSAGEPEKAGLAAGIGLFALGVVLVVFAMQTAHTTADPLVQNERIILAVLGALLGLAGMIVWARYSITRYLRYWLLRTIYEERLQQDRTIEVLERIASKP